MNEETMFDKDELVEVHKCVLCNGDIEHQKTPDGQVYWNRGHNAEPIAKGNCCGTCNENTVIPVRMLQSFGIGERDENL